MVTRKWGNRAKRWALRGGWREGVAVRCSLRWVGGDGVAAGRWSVYAAGSVSGTRGAMKKCGFGSRRGVARASSSVVSGFDLRRHPGDAVVVERVGARFRRRDGHEGHRRRGCA